MGGKDEHAPIPDLRVTAGEDKGSHSLPVAIGRS
jgi:hypothetical protein